MGVHKHTVKAVSICETRLIPGWRVRHPGHCGSKGPAATSFARGCTKSTRRQLEGKSKFPIYYQAMLQHALLQLWQERQNKIRYGSQGIPASASSSCMFASLGWLCISAAHRATLELTMLAERPRLMHSFGNTCCNIPLLLRMCGLQNPQVFGQFNRTIGPISAWLQLNSRSAQFNSLKSCVGSIHMLWM